MILQVKVKVVASLVASDNSRVSIRKRHSVAMEFKCE